MACPFVLPSQNPFCILKCRKGFSLQKQKVGLRQVAFYGGGEAAAIKELQQLPSPSRKKSLTLPHKFLKHNKSAPSAKSARENANRLQKF
jgi:hypothetical protein